MAAGSLDLETVRKSVVSGVIMSITTYGIQLINEELPCECEVHNAMDHYAVAVIRDDVVVGHLPKKISRICSLFLRSGGTIRVKVRRYLVCYSARVNPMKSRN